MSKLGLVIAMMLMVGRTNAQTYLATGSGSPTHFVLIQSDGGQPFYVRLNDELLSSSPAGHLILSRLKDSVYAITVAFPGTSNGGHRYLLDVRQKDMSLRLSLRDDRWGLYDGHDRALREVADPAKAEQPLPGIKKDDPFSQMMSAIVGDTAVMYSTYAEPSHDSVAVVQTRDTSSASGLGVVPSAPTGVIKLSEHRSTQALNLVYTDHPANQNADTIDVMIPIDSRSTSHHSKSDHPVSADTSRLAVSAGRRDSLHYAVGQGRTDSVRDAFVKFSDSTDTQRPDTASLNGRPRKPAPLFVNSDCHDSATEYDVDKLRVRLLRTTKEPERIQAALKVFKTKCFTTRQIRALAEVFTSDGSKFSFLSTAYPFVSDDRFGDLVSLLSDPLYVGKFRAMTEPH